MDHEEDVERLFSWLQTPELRYREFAGAREISDTVVTSQGRPNTTEAVRETSRLRQPDFAEPITAPSIAPPSSRAEPPAAEPAAPGSRGSAHQDRDRDDAAPGEPPPLPDSAQHGERSLDSVFGRLAGTRNRLPDPRERPRQAPGSDIPGGRSR
jgi:hypothetical protein